MLKSACLAYALGVVLSLLASGCTDKIAETEKIGDQIVVALHKHRAEHGRYPNQLEELIPKYFDKIPPPTFGDRKWDYRTPRDGEYFVLSEIPADSDSEDVVYEEPGGWVVENRSN